MKGNIDKILHNDNNYTIARIVAINLTNPIMEWCKANNLIIQRFLHFPCLHYCLVKTKKPLVVYCNTSLYT